MNLTNGSTVTGSAEDAAKAAAKSLSNSSDEDGGTDLPDGEVGTHTPDEFDPIGGASEDEVRAARRQGWTENFKGDPKDFVTAKDFYDRGVQINPILRARVAPLEQENERLKRALAGQAQEISKLNERFVESDRTKLTTRLSELKAAKITAVEEQNGSRLVEIDEEIAEVQTKLRTPVAPVKATQQANEADPVLVSAVTKFTTDHSDWYGKDKRKTALANAIAEEVATDSPQLKGTPEFFEELDKRVRKEFNLSGQATSASLEGGSNSPLPPRTPKGKSWNDIPSRDREVAEGMIRQKLFKDRNEYASYYWDQQ